nr:UDP-N-acetylmuramate dehydrogenase [Planosporangium mesophilum]
MERLASYTTLRLGGPAAGLMVASDEQEIIAALRTDEPVLLLAGGSNVVVSDDGFPGRVVLLRSRGIAVRCDGDRVRLRVAAGEPWDQVVQAAVEAGWSGVESLSGIPGSAGATPIQNVDAYGHGVAETIVEVRAYDRTTDRIVSLTPQQCGFGYRTSVFRQNDRFAVLTVDFSLPLSPLSSPIRYAELARALGVQLGARAPLEAVRAAVLSLRTGKGMVLDASDPDTYSAGSFFINPVIDPVAYARLRKIAIGANVGEPAAWPGADGRTKVSAAWLIERAGFPKGYTCPGTGVAISTKHTLALTNRGTGSTSELLALARKIRDGVAERFGVVLHAEPVLANCAI